MRFCIRALLVVGFFAVGSCENKDVKSISDLRNKRTALEEGHDIEIFLSQGGKTKGKLTAPLLYRYQADSSYSEFPHTLHVDFYNDSMQRESKLDAHYGKYHEWQNKVFLKDSVIVVNLLKGDTLRANEMWWDQNTQKFYTDKPVHISQRDGTNIYGKNGMEAKQDLSERIIYTANAHGPVPADVADSAGGSKDSVHTAPVTPPTPKGGKGDRN